jgi:DNA polymerase-1
LRTNVLYPDFYHDFAQPAMLALARAGNRGCLVDTALRERLKADAEARAAAAQLGLDAICERAVNVNSPKQCAALLYDEWKLPEQRKPSSGGFPGGVTTDEEAIKKVRRLVPTYAEPLTLILDIRGAMKEVSMLSVRLEPRAEGEAFVTSYNATGTTSGRISSSATILGFGDNLQNRSRGPSRRMFVARPGMVFVKGDGSQAEARVVASLMGDVAWLDRFADPLYDVHIENASFVFATTEEIVRAEAKIRDGGERKAFLHTAGLPLGQPPYVDSLRQRSKPVTHGANYKGGPHVAVKMADVPYAEAKVGLERYLRHRHLLPAWWDRVATTLLCERALRTVWGRLRVFLGRVGEESTLREAVAFEPQSTIGDLVNHAFFKLDTELDAIGAYPLLQAHDEIVIECPRERVAFAAERLQHWLQLPLPMETGALRIPAEVKVGVNWYDLEPWKG